MRDTNFDLGHVGPGAVIYLFSITSLGILLATMARSMPQFALLRFGKAIVNFS
ncbi:MAG: hypothetical protein ACR2OL_07730 [Anderseniella sp.]